MAAVNLVTWQTNRRKNESSSTLTIDFSSVRIGADNLEISQTGSGGGAAFNVNSRRIANVATPTSDNDATTKSYVDTLVVTGGRVKEAILSPAQLDAAQGIRAAMIFYATAVAESGDTVILTNGSTTETWTYDAVDGANQPAVGANAAASMQNLATRINTDSSTWGAVFIPDALDSLNSGGGVVVVYEEATAGGASTSRMYGVWNTAASAQTIPYNASAEYNTSNTPVQLPAADPAAGRFGFRRQLASLVNGEIHLTLASDTLHSWDDDENSWVTLSAGGLADATAGSGGGTKGKVTADTDKGLNIVSGVLEAKVSGQGIDFSSGNIALKIDGSTLSQSASGAKVADAGITGTQLNTSVAGNGLTGGGGSALAVGAGDGIAVEADAVRADYTDTFVNDNAGSITVRQIVYIKADGDVDLARADVSNLFNFDLGVVYASSIAAAASGLITVRRGALIGGFTGLTPGQKVYVDRSTAGAYTQDLSGFVANEHVYRVGRAISATEMIFDPEHEIEL